MTPTVSTPDAQEMVDIVNEKDELIGWANKDLVHALNHIHRCVGFVVFRDDSRQQILTQVRSDSKELNPGQIGLGAGHVKSGETYEDAVRREFKEEVLGEYPIPENVQFQYLFTANNFQGGHREIKKYFTAIYPGPFNWDINEVQSVTFRNIQELLEDMQQNPTKFTKSSQMVVARLTNGQNQEG